MAETDTRENQAGAAAAKQSTQSKPSAKKSSSRSRSSAKKSTSSRSSGNDSPQARPTKSQTPPKDEQVDGRPNAVRELDERDPNRAEKHAAQVREDRAKTVSEQQAAQLAAGEKAGRGRDRSKTPIAEQRAGHRGATPIEGRVDNMTRRSDADVLTGHFCVIDYSKIDKAALAAVESIVGEGNAGAGSADYGVFLQAGSLDDDGYPETAVVLLRDEHAAQVIVPYAALRPAAAGGRR